MAEGSGVVRDFFMVVFFIREAKNNFAILKNTDLTDGTLRSKPMKSLVNNTYWFNWGSKKSNKKAYEAKVLFARTYLLSYPSINSTC
jgi:hypothetical protein